MAGPWIIRPILCKTILQSIEWFWYAGYETWVREGKTVALEELPMQVLGPQSVLDTRAERWVGDTHMKVVFLQDPSWTTSVLVVLVNHLMHQLEPETRWFLEFLRLIILEVFNIHADVATSSQAMGLVPSIALGLSQIVLCPTHQAGHTLDLVFGIGKNIDLKKPSV